MLLTDLVAPNAVMPALKVNSKKQALQELAAKAAQLTGQSERAVLEVLMQREKLGSTGVGNGIAIPHGKLANLAKLFGLFARLDRPVDFEALDGQAVDLVFLLLAPETAGADHLKALAPEVPGVVLAPIGFVSDHMEVAFDLDTEALSTARELDLPAARAATVGTHPAFVAAVVDLLLERAAIERGEPVGRASIGPPGPSHDVCPANCCPNPRGLRPALCGVPA